MLRGYFFLGSCIYPKNSNQPIKEDELLKSSLEKLMNGVLLRLVY